MTLLDPSLKHFARETVKIKTPLTYNSYGRVATWTTERAYKARIEHRPRQVLNTQGEVVLASTIVSIAEANAQVTTKSVMTMPDDTTPDIVSVETSQDRKGRSYSVVYLQWSPRS